MKPHERESLVGLYESRYAELGQHVNSLGWNTRADQRLRFQVLGDIANLAGASVCDIGCGFGDLYPYLLERFTNVDYLGVDITPSFVESARIRHPSVPFICGDILDGLAIPPADYFLLSGALNYRVENNWDLTVAMIRRMFSLARKGVGVNFLSTYVNFQRPLNYHHDPEMMFSFARGLTRWVTLRHDYPLWEFTLFLYHESRE
jgi:SAM-dependent methyltransferase